MRRNVFDKVASVGGVVVVIVLAVAGALLMFGYSFANNYVHTQLAEQQITFPSAAAFAHPDGQEITKSMIPSVSQYAGQQLVTGQQAQVYANDFINVHLGEIGGGKTYSELSRRRWPCPRVRRPTRPQRPRSRRSSRARRFEVCFSRPTGTA